MAEIGISIVAKVVEYLAQPVIRQGQYLFYVNKFLKDLENNKKELVSTLDGVLIRVKEGKGRTERIEDVVQKWLNDVQHLLAEVENLEQEVKANIGCFEGGCPTWRRYLLCKKMAVKTKEMTGLNKSNFQTFGSRATLPGPEYSATEDFTFFEATKLAYDQLLEALQDDGINKIGLHGMGGSGKTTLVIEVCKEAKKLNLFDLVVEITLSQTPNIRNIQGQMADMLMIELKEESEVGRAKRLHLRLKVEKRILVIVDDIWGDFDFKKVGITYDACNCKFILTTRCRPVCTLMDCQKQIQLNLMNEVEAWDLFKKHADIDDRSYLNSVAQNVARECKGLPIAIKTVGRALKRRSMVEWEVALEDLRSSKQIYPENGQRDAFSCLKLSYDYLKDENDKVLFLMCCIFPEDHIFCIEDLIRCGVGLGVYGQYPSFDSARKQVRVGINKLIDSCLLMHYKNTFGEKDLKMHDTIRDLGLWISSEEGRAIKVNPSNNFVIENHFAVSSWYGSTIGFSNQFVAPKLEILWIKTHFSLDLSSASFEALQRLKVMVLRNNGRGSRLDLSLPPSMESLTNLRTLCLTGWILDDISFIVRLTRLEILELKSCVFNELPKEITDLKNLKLLDLSQCANLDNYESSVQLPQIEELYVSAGYNKERWICPSPSFVDNIAAINLQRYVLNFSSHWYTYEIQRAVLLRSINMSSVSASMKKLLQRAEYVSFEGLRGDFQNIFPNIFRAVGDMNDLAEFDLSFCLETECVLDNTSDQLDGKLPKLVDLRLYNMKNLKEVCRGPPLFDFFEKLQVLSLISCGELHNIFPRESKLPNLKILRINRVKIAALFSMSISQSLANLEELEIYYISELKQIITEEDGDGTNTVESPVEGLKQLEEIEIKFLFNSKLKYVFSEYDQRDHSFQEKSIRIPLPMLKELRLQCLENLHSICPEKYHLWCPSLKKLSVVYCQKLTKLCVMIGSEVVKQPHEHECCDSPNCQVLLAFHQGLTRCKDRRLSQIHSK